MQNEIILTSTQQEAATGLKDALAPGAVLALRGAPGLGKSTILQWLHAECGGALVGAHQFMQRVTEGRPSALEEAFLRMIDGAMVHHDLIMVDDLHLVTN